MQKRFLCPQYSQWLISRPAYARAQVQSHIDSAKLFTDQYWASEAIVFAGKALEIAWSLLRCRLAP